MRLTLILMLFSSAAAAQTGTLIQGRESKSSMVGMSFDLPTEYRMGAAEIQPTELALSSGRAMAACAWKRRPDQAAQLLAATDVSKFNAMYEGLSSTLRRCLEDQQGDNAASIRLRMPNSTVRGLFADARFGRDGVPKLSSARYVSVEAGSDWITADPGQKVLLRTSDCLAARYPGESANLLATQPNSAAEKTAFGPIAAALSGCLEKGVTLSARRSALRLTLASAMDRRTRSAAETAATDN